MGFLDELSTIPAPGQSPEQIGQAQYQLLLQWLFQHPAELFAELRASRPILVLNPPGPAVVTLFHDVLEVADRTDDFTVAPYGATNAVVMGGSNFLLGMDNVKEHSRERSVLRNAVLTDDLCRIGSFASDLASSMVSAALPTGSLDVVDLAHSVPLALAGSYFGVPGPDAGTLGAWVRAIFTELFFNLTQSPAIQQAGKEAGASLATYIDGLIQDAHTVPCSDTLLGRLIEMQSSSKAASQDSLSDERVRVNMIGLLEGMVENTTMAVCNVVDMLLSNPPALAGASDAAQRGDRALLLQYVLESLRFHSPAPILVRLCARDSVLASGSGHETSIRQGQLVFAVTGSAMMDPSTVENPTEFRVGRPIEQYLHFGWGMHRCFGEYISRVQVTEVVRSVLRLKGLRRAEGAAGTLQYAGPYPQSFTVQFDPPTCA